MNGYIKVSNWNKSLSPVPTDERKDTHTKKKLWNKIRDLIRSITDNSENYVEKYMKIKFNSDDGLPRTLSR